MSGCTSPSNCDSCTTTTTKPKTKIPVMNKKTTEVSKKSTCGAEGWAPCGTKAQKPATTSKVSEIMLIASSNFFVFYSVQRNRASVAATTAVGTTVSVRVQELVTVVALTVPPVHGFVHFEYSSDDCKGCRGGGCRR